MKGRRGFLKGSVIVVAAAAVSGPARILRAMEGLPGGLIYTKENPGRWEGKQGGHAPQAKVEGRKVAIVTPHPMTAEHFIVRHTLVGADGEVIGSHTFTPSDPKAESTYDLPAGASGKFYATSFCNIHDFWMTEFAV